MRFSGTSPRTIRRADADFSVKVAEDVYWVPANALGTSDYTNAQIQAMVTGTPEEKQADIIVINTCAVREHAEQRVLGNVGALVHTK